MSVFWIVFLTTYAFGLFISWLFILIDDADSIKPFFNKHYSEKLTLDEWIKVCWVLFLWPISIVIAYFKYGFIPTLKFIYKFFIFGLKFIIYPFTLLFKNNNKEPFKDKLGKFIVKLFKL